MGFSFPEKSNYHPLFEIAQQENILPEGSSLLNEDVNHFMSSLFHFKLIPYINSLQATVNPIQRVIKKSMRGLNTSINRLAS